MEPLEVWTCQRAENLKKKLNIEKHGAIGGLDLPEGKELKEEDMDLEEGRHQ